MSRGDHPGEPIRLPIPRIQPRDYFRGSKASVTCRWSRPSEWRFPPREEGSCRTDTRLVPCRACESSYFFRSYLDRRCFFKSRPNLCLAKRFR